MRLLTITLAAALLFAQRAESAVDQIQIVAGGTQRLAVGVDGTLYVSGHSSLMKATPGAFMTSGGNINEYVMHIDPRTGAVLYATYLNFTATAIAVDPAGSLFIAGTSTDPNFATTPGAYQTPVRGRETMVIAKMNPTGTAMEWITVLGGSGENFIPPGTSGAVAIATGPDGSVYVTGTTYSKDFPITGDAFQRQKVTSSGYTFFTALSNDASKILYSTYLSGSGGSSPVDLMIDNAGAVYLAGTTFSQDFPTTPGSYSSQGGRIFAARWNSTSRVFDYVAAFGNATMRRMAVDGKGRMVLLVVANFTSSSLTVINEAGTGIISPAGSLFDPAQGSFVTLSMTLDEDGNVIIAGSTSGPPGTDKAPTIGANQLFTRSPYYGQRFFVAKLNGFGPRQIYSTPIDAQSVSAAIYRSGTLYVPALAGYGGTPDVQPAFAATSEPPLDDRRSALFAIPNTFDTCYALPKTNSMLYWDTRNPAVEAVEVHRGTPDGPRVGTGLTGTLSFPLVDGDIYFLQDVTGGKPLTSANTLAVEQISVKRYAHCTGVTAPAGQLVISPNPNLACKEPGVGDTAALLTGTGPDPKVEIRVKAPNGPLFSGGPGVARDFAGDWIRDGMDFFLLGAGGRLLASDRISVLPIRSCLRQEQTPVSIQATPRTVLPCSSGSISTLAWYTGYQPVEIREGSPDGRVLGRFDQTQGLLDVRPANSQQYFLMVYWAGAWQPYASAAVQADRTQCAQ